MTVILLGMAILLLAIAPAAMAQVVDGTPDRPEERAPAKEGVEPVIPLNKDDPTYDLWKKMREDLADGREPGPINIQRYYGGTGWNGIPTFFRLPVALLPADLAAGDAVSDGHRLPTRAAQTRHVCQRQITSA